MIRALIVLALMMAASPSEACTFLPSRVSPHTVDAAEADDAVAPVVAFDIEVQVVDENGNVSEPKRVHIENGSGGCSTTRSDWTVVPVLALLLRRRRRR